ncbi:MAG: tRNA (adenosine(37)-N6)-threonylcarbamoyltransferase complex ATPase subunit type 1 TsaE [Chitinivibrionales bacterium]|nr:tRNA (adenosine(37)-N6)-threonylcarbamoyltransferase complex ATPase subunit type 1 TsaE [Chitinivibrionales bacterium]
MSHRRPHGAAEPMSIVTNSTDETRALGARIAGEAQPGDIYALIGALGTGKTEFVRGFVAALDPRAPVRSPSFTLLNIYETPRFPIYHFDFYRLTDPGELTEIGLNEYLAGEGVCLIEWADMFLDELPVESLHTIRFEDAGESRRRIAITGPAGE